MSGWRKRLKRTSPSAPASSSRNASSPVELKYGASLTATGTVTASLTRAKMSRWRCSTSRPEVCGSPGQVVDVQLDRGRAGVLHRHGVVGPTARRDAVEAADHRDVDGGHGALEQAQVGARAGLLFGLVREVRQRLGEALGCRPLPSPHPAPPAGAAAPRRASRAPPRRPRRRPAGARRRRVCDSGDGDATSGLRRVRPRYSVDRSISRPCEPSDGNPCAPRVAISS